IAVTNPFNIDTEFATQGAGTLFVDAGTPDSSVEQVELRTGSDADEIDVAGLSTLTALRVLAGGGDDVVLVGNDFDSNINGTLALDGGAGDDLLLLNDSADAFGDAYLFGISGDPTFGKDSTASVMTYSNFST